SPIADLGEVAAVPFLKRQIAGVAVALAAALARRFAFLAANTLLGEARPKLSAIGDIPIGKQPVTDKQDVDGLTDADALGLPRGAGFLILALLLVAPNGKHPVQ